MSEAYRELAKRIRAAGDSATLYRLENSSTRLYVAGLLTAKELGRLDVLIMERLALL